MGKRTVLVTGGTGVVGAWAVRALDEAGFAPVIFTRGLTVAGERILGSLAQSLRRVRGDVESPMDLVRAICASKPYAIAHLASAKPWEMEPGSPSDADPGLAFRRNVTGTGNVLEAARSLGVHRVVFMSSKAAYGPFPAPGSRDAEGGVPEDYPARPQDLYGLSKLSAEALCGYYRTVLGLDVVCLRGATAYGPFKRGAGLSPPGLIGAALEGTALRATYAESAYRVVVDEYVYNADIGRAVALAVAAPRTTRLLFNIGTGVGLTTEALVEAMGRVEGLAVPVVSVVPDDDPSVDGGHIVPNQAGVLDVSAAREELGFAAGYDVEAGLAHALTILRGQ